MLKIICLLKSGGDYAADYVYNLKLQVSLNLTIPYEFICYSDVPEVADRPLLSGRKGYWVKPEVFRETGACIFFDLDTSIHSNIDEFAANVLKSRDCLFMLKTYPKKKKGKVIRRTTLFSSAIMAWNGDFSVIDAEYNSTNPMGPTDQNYITMKCLERHIRVEYVNSIAAGIYGYKRHIRDADQLPDDLHICHFCNKPRPRDVKGIFFDENAKAKLT